MTLMKARPPSTNPNKPELAEPSPVEMRRPSSSRSYLTSSSPLASRFAGTIPRFSGKRFHEHPEPDRWLEHRYVTTEADCEQTSNIDYGS
jgi:hypothetical protein